MVQKNGETSKKRFGACTTGLIEAKPWFRVLRDPNIGFSCDVIDGVRGFKQFKPRSHSFNPLSSQEKPNHLNLTYPFSSPIYQPPNADNMGLSENRSPANPLDHHCPYMSLCFHGYILAISALTYCWSYPCGPDHGMNKPLDYGHPLRSSLQVTVLYLSLYMYAHYKALYYNVYIYIYMCVCVCF